MFIRIEASPAMSITSASGIAELRADRRGQAVAHRAEPARGQPVVRLLEVEVLRRPHLVLADFGGDDRRRASLVSSYSRSDRVLRLDRIGRVCW